VRSRGTSARRTTLRSEAQPALNASPPAPRPFVPLGLAAVRARLLPAGGSSRLRRSRPSRTAPRRLRPRERARARATRSSSRSRRRERARTRVMPATPSRTRSR
jgi:hypothetical protein